MANMEQLMHVGQSCPGYEALGSGFENSIGLENSKSCTNCHNYQGGKCVVNLFDKVLCGLDQT